MKRRGTLSLRHKYVDEVPSNENSAGDASVGEGREAYVLSGVRWHNCSGCARSRTNRLWQARGGRPRGRTSHKCACGTVYVVDRQLMISYVSTRRRPPVSPALGRPVVPSTITNVLNDTTVYSKSLRCCILQYCRCRRDRNALILHGQVLYNVFARMFVLRLNKMVNMAGISQSRASLLVENKNLVEFSMKC